MVAVVGSVLSGGVLVVLVAGGVVSGVVDGVVESGVVVGRVGAVVGGVVGSGAFVTGAAIVVDGEASSPPLQAESASATRPATATRQAWSGKEGSDRSFIGIVRSLGRPSLARRLH